MKLLPFFLQRICLIALLFAGINQPIKAQFGNDDVAWLLDYYTQLGYGDCLANAPEFISQAEVNDYLYLNCP
ncbi:MAG: hypothetical protein KA783_06375, partial [Chitinophagales bacterium]|nr:hypothetical protein [Chitinophagales bacterium]